MVRGRSLVLHESAGLADVEQGVPIGPGQKAERLRAVGIIPMRHEGRVVACLKCGGWW